MGRVVFYTQVARMPRLPFFYSALASIISGFFIPLTLFALFFLPLRLLGGFGLVVCTECTSNVWVGGVAKVVVWLAAEYCIDNCCNCFVNYSAGLV
jgi:hypothetical protein